MDIALGLLKIQTFRVPFETTELNEPAADILLIVKQGDAQLLQLLVPNRKSIGKQMGSPGSRV